jgi:nucleoid DNA-binding protein
MSKEEFITEEKVINTPAGGVLIGKDKEGQTIIPNDGSLGGFLIGRLHKDGGIKAVNKSTGQPLEMQGNEIIITAPAVADQAKHTFDGKTMTNREILSKINSDGGGVSFANGGEIPAKIHTTDKEHDFDGKKVNDSEIANYLGMKSTLKNGSQLFSSGNTTFDVDAIYKAIDSGNILYEVKEVGTFPMKYSVYDKKYSETVKPDFNKPNGITVLTESGEEVLIDGNHRMNNAYINGLKKIKTYYISDLKEIEDFTKKNKFKIGGENKVGGHLSKGKNLEQIANMHNVSLAHINEQLEKGLEVEKEHFADFKERTRVAKDHLVENPNYYTILEKAGLESGGGLYDSKPFLDYYFEQIAEFLKDQNNIDLKEDFTFFYKGENFTVEPMLLIDKNKEAPLKTANFTILDNEGEVVGEIDFKENIGNSEDKKKQFTAYSEFFNWDNFKFENGGHFDDGGSVNYENESSFNDKSKFLKAFYKTNNPSVDKLLLECQPLINELIEKQKEIHLKETFNMFGVAKPMNVLDLEYYEIGLLYKMVHSFNKYLRGNT